MVYNSFNFLVIFPLIFLLYYLIPARMNKVRTLFLLVVSYSLYMSWNPLFVLVLGGGNFSILFNGIGNRKKETAKIMGFAHRNYTYSHTSPAV